MMLPAVEIGSLKKSFGAGNKKRQVLQDLTLTISQGEVFGFLGPNGAGKSTTIKLILGFLRPDSGGISIFGKKTHLQEFRNDIGYLSEFPCFYGHLTARETLQLSGRLSGVPKHFLLQRIPSLLDRLNLLDAIDRRVRDFSKGMKQRLGMANALIHDPQLLIFDEPMSGLDPLGRYLVKEMLNELRGKGKTIFFSSHILSDIEEICDRIGVIHKGRQMYAGTIADFLPHGKRLEEQFIQVIKTMDHAESN